MKKFLSTIFFGFLVSWGLITWAAPLSAQVSFGTIDSDAPKSESAEAEPEKATRGPELGKAKVYKYKAGMIIEARPKGTCSDILGTVPVPMEYPEQKVRILEEVFDKSARVRYRDLKEGGARELVFAMRTLHPGQRVESTVTYEVTRYQLLPPTETLCYRIPPKTTREIRQYLKKSQYMESESKTIRNLGRDLVQNVDSDWGKVEAFFQYIRKNITYKEEQAEKPIRGALAALKTKEGDCEDMCALFIALCRSQNIPARLVRVPEHCYAEFYLVDEKDNGYWFPAQVSGTEPFGGLQDQRIILQKGDRFHLPESPKVETLYVKELFTGQVKENSPDPIHEFIHEVLQQ